MATSPFFNHFTNSSEQSLLNDLVKETVKIHGIDVKYLPRTLVNIDKIFGEEGISQFNSATEIEMYISSVNGFSGEGDFYSKFGLQIRDQLIMTVSRQRWTELGVSERPRPFEGDLIYFPLNDKLFEIKFVEHERMFYSLGELPVYELTCELFEYSSEQFSTGNTSIDDIETTIFSDTSYTLVVENHNGTDYEIGETAVQKDTNGDVVARGTVTAWDSGTLELEIQRPVGMMSVGNIIYGQESGAESDYVSSPTLNVESEKDIDPGSDNTDLQNRSDNIFDFTETDPFSEGNY